MAESGVNIEIANFAEGIPGLATNIYNGGDTLYSNVKDVYAQIKTLNASWQGKRYDDLLAAFNGELPKFQNMVTLLMNSLPVALNKVAKNYAGVNGDANYGQGSAGAKTLEKLDKTNDSGKMRYVQADVEAQKLVIDTALDTIKTTLSTIGTTYVNSGSMAGFWNSAASAEYISQFTSLKGSIDAAIDSLKSQFATLMTTAQQEIASAESNSTVTLSEGGDGAGGTEA